MIAFDAFHHTETGPGATEPELDVASGNRNHAVPYDPTPWRVLPWTVRLASLPAEGYTFVDVGCGKGKILVSALRYPFTRIVGVEFSPHLCVIAKNNLANVRFLHRRCREVEVICTDAVAYPIPDGPAIFFFYNPFSYHIMETMIRNIVSSYLASRRPIFLILYAASSSPEIAELLRRETSGSVCQRASGVLGDRPVVVFGLAPK